MRSQCLSALAPKFSAFALAHLGLALAVHAQCVNNCCNPWKVQQAGASCSVRAGVNCNPAWIGDECGANAITSTGETSVALFHEPVPGNVWSAASTWATSLDWTVDASLAHAAGASAAPYHSGAATRWNDQIRILGGTGAATATLTFQISGATASTNSCVKGHVRFNGLEQVPGGDPLATPPPPLVIPFTYGSPIALEVELLAYVGSMSNVVASGSAAFQMSLASVDISPAPPRFWIVSSKCGVYPNATPLPSTRIYVDANAVGADDGTSWSNAFTRLQDALLIGGFMSPTCLGAPRVEIWTGPGSYRPDEGLAEVLGNIDASFYLRENVDLVGGLPVGATSLAQQDTASHVCVLTGELTTPGAFSRHVVRAANVGAAGGSTSIDGFTIQKGRALGTATAHDGRGGGLLAAGEGDGDSANLDVNIKHCRFLDNHARLDGGAIFANLFFRPLTIVDCAFEQNVLTTSGGSGGGAVHLSGGASGAIQGCSFLDNQSLSTGGAVANYGHYAVLIEDSAFRSNTAPPGFGGAIAHFAVTSGPSPQPTVLTVRRCSFAENAAARGGAIAAERSDLSGSVWTDNTASLHGGAVHLAAAGGWSSTITSCAMSGNTTTSSGGRGGGIYCTTLLTMDRCELSGNQARDSGGAVFHSGNQIDLKQCALVKNTALQVGGGGGGGGLRTLATSAVLTNCTIADNVGGFPYRHDVYSNSLIARNTVIDTGLNYGTSFSGGPLTQFSSLIELGADVQNPGFRDRVGGDYRLASTSICIDQGDAGLLGPATEDLDGQPRFVDEPLVVDAVGVPAPAVDIGALESQGYHRGIVYCTAGTTTNGCTPMMSASGEASASGATSFVVTASHVESNKQGLLFYGVTGALAAPWGSGGSSYRCVAPPTQRTGVQNSGGLLVCDGQLVLDWNAYRASHPSALGTPFTVGDPCWIQGWFRDPPAVKSTNLTNALEFLHLP